MNAIPIPFDTCPYGGISLHPALRFRDAPDDDEIYDDIDAVDPAARAREIFAEQGYPVPKQLIADGKFHHFSPSGKRGDDSTSYALHLNEWPHLIIWDHRTGGSQSFPLSDKKPSAEQRKQIDAQIAAAKAERERETARKHATAATEAERIWNAATPARADHAYLVKKRVQPHGLREHEGRLVVPMYREDKIVGLQFIDADGGKRFLTGAEKKNAYCVIGDLTGDIALCEGWATGASIHEATGMACIVAFDAGNLLLVAKSFEGHPGVATICADDDWRRTDENIGVIKAREAARLTGAKFAVPVFGEDRGEKDTDFNDLARTHGLDAVKACIARADYVKGEASGEEADVGVGETETAEHAPLTSGFRYGDDGSIEHVVGKQKEDELVWTTLCSPIQFVATTEDAEGKRGGVLVRVRNDSGNWHRLAFARSDLVDFDNLLRTLMDHGLRITTTGRDVAAFKRLLSWAQPENRARCVERVGWHGDAFVLPDETIGRPADLEIIFQPTSGVSHAYRVNGTFEGWKTEIGARAVGNSRLQLALSAALTGPLLQLAPMEGGGLHFRGASSTGKTTALHCAGSVWGGGGARGFIDSWRVTDNGLEGMALVRNDTLLLLDEMAQVEPKAAAQTAYMLANGRGKARANRDGGAGKIPEWQTMFISTGEISLAAKMAEGGMRSTAGQEVRVIDIPADAGAGFGLLENLHGFRRPHELADALRDSAQRHYGHAARAFLAALTRDVAGYTEVVRRHVKTVRSQICPTGAASQVGRVADRFSLVAAAGELAIQFGVFPWPAGDADKAAARCFSDWLGQRGGPEQKEDADAVDCVVGWLQRFSSRFRNWEAPSATIFDCAGYVKQPIDRNTPRAFYVFANVFKDEICAKSGLDPTHTANILAKAGYLTKSADGKNTRKIRLPMNEGPRVYTITMPQVEASDVQEGDEDV